MRLRATPLCEHDIPHGAFHLGLPATRGAEGAGRGVAARSVLMRFSAAGPTVLATGLFVALALSASACAKHPPVEQATSVAPATVAPRTPPTARPVPPDPRVGAVFLGEGSLHTCTGAVLHSAAGDLILTAAHCVAEGLDATFVAGLNDTAAPEDVWHIDAVYLDQRWVQNQDPLADFAIARVRRGPAGTRIVMSESVVGVASAAPTP